MQVDNSVLVALIGAAATLFSALLSTQTKNGVLKLLAVVTALGLLSFTIVVSVQPGFVCKLGFELGLGICETPPESNSRSISESHVTEGWTAANGEDMQVGESLAPDQPITSIGGHYRLQYQWDGNLVLYRQSDSQPLWASDTAGSSFGDCVMQHDGNLVIHDAEGRPVWDSGTSGYPGARLVVQDDGNTVIYDSAGEWRWSTMSGLRQ